MKNQILSISFAVLSAFGAAAHASSFAISHPDLHFRSLALREMEDGHENAAFGHFLRSARYADKVSQLSVSAMYLKGEGIARDPVLSYVWADLAAERGYPDFVAFREYVWERLDETQRAEAQRLGAEIFSEYGDKVAKKRMESLLHRTRLGKTGSRTSANHDIRMSDFSNWQAMGTADYVRKPYPRLVGTRLDGGYIDTNSTRGSNGFWADENWKPEAYWKAQDRRFKRGGVVSIGELISD